MNEQEIIEKLWDKVEDKITNAVLWIAGGMIVIEIIKNIL